MKLSNLQITSPKDWSGLTSKNHIANIFNIKPQAASTIVGRMLAQQYGTSLDSALSELPVKVLESDDDFTWKLMGASDQNVPLVEARYQGSVVTEADVNIGQAGAVFELVFPKRWFSPTSVIVGEKNEKYPIQIREEYQEGTNVVYECVVWGSAANLTGIPGEELVAGKLFSEEYAPVEESFSVRGSELHFAGVSTFKNTFTRIRKQYTVPGNMVNRKVVGTFDFIDSKGQKKSMTTWMQYNAFQFEQEIMMDKNRAMYFGKTTLDQQGNLSNDGKSGQGIRAGYGLREQMEVSNTYFYNKFTYDLITNILTELAEGKLAMDERKFVIRTGERGATLIHQAIRNEASGWTPLQDTTAHKQVSSKLHSNARQWGFQYTEFIAPNNIYVRVEVDPLYSDPTRNKIQAPNNGNFKGGLAESYRMDIFDIGTTDGEPNIQKVVSSQDGDVTGYIPGLRDPYSPTGERSKLMASPVDGFEVHKMCTFGVMLKDPSRTASLIPSILS